MTSRLNVERAQWLRETWAGRIDHWFFSDHEDVAGRVLKVSSDTSPRSNEEKQIAFVNRAGRLGLLDAYRWLFLVDDDTFVNVRVLRERIGEMDPRAVHGYRFSGNESPENAIYRDQRLPTGIAYVSGGAGILVSTDVIRKVGWFRNYRTGYGDVSLGINFKRCRVPVRACPLMWSQRPEFYGHTAEQARGMISYHYVRTREQIERLLLA